MSDLYVVSSSPHVRDHDNVNRVMRDVVIALIPTTLVGIYTFGLRALAVVLISILAAVGSEALYQKLTHQKVTITDWSAIITGLLLGLNLSSTVPFFIPVIGSIFSIIIVKQLFGGLGQNFMNPALAARAFLLISFAGYMSSNYQIDAVSTATPLGIIKEGLQAEYGLPSISNLFFGHVAGCIGEVSAAALLLGGIYLIARKVISFRIPVSYILTVAVLVLVLGGKGFDLSYMAYHLFAGGLMIGAFFMATDYSSSPVTPVGQYIMGFGCGLLTVLIRLYGGYPEGVSFAILIMNMIVPLIDRFTIPKSFGEVAK